MSFGQDMSEGDERGVIPREQAASIRNMRASEQWERYDSIVVGQGAALRSRGWFNTWADFANADSLVWFSGREAAVGSSYCNQPTERTDWAQDLHQTCIEFVAPPGLGDVESDSNEQQLVQELFTQILPNMMPFRVVLAESDEIAKAPGSHFPASFGVQGAQLSASGAPSALPGSQGVPHVSNSWRWPEPIMLAAKAKLTVTAQIDDPIKTLFRTLPGPGTKLIPDGAGGTISMPNYYIIRVTFRGPRYLQLRGARSSA